MDLRLPVMGGIEAAQRIRSMDGGAEVKIAALTASAFTSQREEVLAAGFDDFLRKPYRSSEIFDCMARHLGARYIYAAPDLEPARSLAVLRPEDMAVLPEDLRRELKDALLALDLARIANAIHNVAEQRPLTGDALARLAEQYTYTPILRALEECERRYSGAKA
jgi:CheY-like chemotaxis protein